MFILFNGFCSSSDFEFDNVEKLLNMMIRVPLGFAALNWGFSVCVVILLWRLFLVHGF